MLPPLCVVQCTGNCALYDRGTIKIIEHGLIEDHSLRSWRQIVLGKPRITYEHARPSVLMNARYN